MMSTSITITDSVRELVRGFQVHNVPRLLILKIDSESRQIVQDHFQSRNLQCKLQVTPLHFLQQNPLASNNPDAINTKNVSDNAGEDLNYEKSITQEFEYCGVCTFSQGQGKDHFGEGAFYIDAELRHTLRSLGMTVDEGRVCQKKMEEIKSRFNQDWTFKFKGVDPQAAFILPVDLMGSILHCARDEEVLCHWMGTCKAFYNAGQDAEVWAALVQRRLGPQLAPPDSTRPLLPHTIGCPRYLLAHSRATKRNNSALQSLVDPSNEPSNEALWEAAMRVLPEDDCRYVVMVWKGEQSSKKGFFLYCPERAPTRSKMLYAGTKDTVKRAVSVNFEMSLDEKYSYQSMRENIQGRLFSCK